jgi:hypothetical protein
MPMNAPRPMAGAGMGIPAASPQVPLAAGLQRFDPRMVGMR